MSKLISNKALETKARITRIAEALFIEKGYAATTLREIAAQANVTTGAFYKYYSCKEDILISIFNEGFTKQWEKFFELKEDFTPINYAEMVGDMNKGLVSNFGLELLKVYCSAQLDMGNQGSLWKVLDSEKYSLHDQMLLEELVNKYSTKYSWTEVDDIILKVDRGVILDWLIKQGTHDIREATIKMLLMVFREIFDKWDW
ncbi:TetR/AcrR family transcriptional regulator [Wukongibacter sp. M2B1]|uniref:TetR/AcrR family transcriptional regulator n=1 Tax=Wukongibacter sp. M2B1 TaxID=3088895 RepID=UPI003D7944B8